jgi:hypothetical protein
MECHSCRSISGEKRISPGPFIYEGAYWLVDPAYPTSHLGWLVIVLKRHFRWLGLPQPSKMQNKRGKGRSYRCTRAAQAPPPILSTTPAPTTLFSGHVGAGEVGKGGGACAAHVPVQRTRKLVQRFSGYDAFRIMINSAEGF